MRHGWVRYYLKNSSNSRNSMIIIYPKTTHMFFKGPSNLAALNVETVKALAIFLQNQ